MSEEKSIVNQSILLVNQLEEANNKTIATELRDPYKIDNNDSPCDLSHSPRAKTNVKFICNVNHVIDIINITLETIHLSMILGMVG